MEEAGVVTRELTKAEIESIPDIDATKYNTENLVRRSSRMVKKRDFFKPDAPKAKSRKIHAVTSGVPRRTKGSEGSAPPATKPSKEHLILQKITSGGVSKKPQVTKKKRARSSRKTSSKTSRKAADKNKNVLAPPDDSSSALSDPPSSSQLDADFDALISKLPSGPDGSGSTQATEVSTLVTEVSTLSTDDSTLATEVSIVPVMVSTKPKFELAAPVRPPPRRPMNLVPMPRPHPIGMPRVWSDSRHALCETLPYFRAWQSAAYLSGGYCLSLLVDKQGSDRDAITENVVITRCGGGMTRLESGMTQTADQTSEKGVVLCMNRNLKDMIPIILIVGQGNPNFPTEIPHRYCVMDHFYITKIWCERVGTKKVFMFRFERVLSQAACWWAPPRALGTLASRASNEQVKATCAFCRKEEEQIYVEGWMCLNEACPAFWTLDMDTPPRELEHLSNFLQPRLEYDARRRAPCALVPHLPSAEADPTFAVSRVCWKGVVCRRCGACISRIEWTAGWICTTPGCNFRYNVPLIPITAYQVADPHAITITGHAIPTTQHYPDVHHAVRLTAHYRINTYTILGCGTITHFQPNVFANQRRNGPDDLFVQLQETDVGLKRFPLSNSLVPGALTAHFAVNYGMPYKYVVAVDSKSFGEAPKAILRALHRLTWAGEQAVTDGTFQKFNELLTVGYFQEQKMGFHDDGERTLGPTIATLSLGGEATMSFRMKKRHYLGFSKSGVYQMDQEPMPGCLEYERRLELYRNRYTISDAHRTSLLNEIVESATMVRVPASPQIIRTTLKHGDMIVMHGENIQQYYEHAVHPSGKLRFALTCRYVDPGLVDRNQHWKGDYVDDPDYQYDGDENRTDTPTVPNSGWGAV